jgi:methionine synthase I (cobalamin-dependent)
MHTVIAELTREGPVVIDGAWGTQFQARGLPNGQTPDGWNLTHADLVEEIPRAYVDAGSRVVLTNTFRGNRLALDGADLADCVVEVNRAGAAISKRAAGERAAVFGSIGPSGKMLCLAEVTADELRDVFVQQAAALADGGADGLVIETMSDLDEVKLAVEAAKSTGLPVVACMCFDSGAENDRTMMGITPEQAAEGLQNAGADVIGANCGQGIDGYIPIARRLSLATDLPIWIKANAGIPKVVGAEVIYETTPEQFASRAGELLEAGVSFIGGCCGTSPDFVRALRKELVA